MSPIPGSIRVAPTGDLLDTVLVEQAGKDDLVHREVMVLGDPENPTSLQAIDAIAKAARVVLYDAAGNIITDTTANAAKSLLVNAAGTAISAQATQNGTSLKVTSLPLISDGFEGYGEVNGANGVNIDVWMGPTTVQPEPVPAGFIPNVISSSADDAVGGSGIAEVTTLYLDTAGAQQKTTFPMTGLTQSVHPSITDCMFINDFYATQLDGDISAAGNIDIRQPDGTVMNRIEIAGNWALSTMRQVPVGKRLCVPGWHCSSGVGTGGKLATVRLRTTSDRFGVALPAGLYLFKDTSILRDSSSPHMPFTPLISVPALSTIKVSVWTSGSVNVSATWHGWLESV